MKVLNKKDNAQGVYVGRPSQWGNPYVIGKDGNRVEVIARFRAYAERRLQAEPEWLKPLVGRDLVCWCAPEGCHADVLIQLANAQ
jgi:hypothetical protein